MKKFFKTLLTLLVSTAILVSGVVAVSADGGTNEIMPRWNVVDQKNIIFKVANNNAIVNVTYDANSTNFQKANLTVKIQKRFLLVFWSTVDIGYTNNVLSNQWR